MASLNDLQLASDDIDFLQDSTGLTPRYLFRTYSESSAGKNGPGEFFSATYASGIGHQSFFTIPPSKAKQMLDEHVRWFNMPNDEFISWSSSILFVLQHAVRKKAYHKDKDIHLCILDTHQMDCTFYTAVTLLRFYNVPSVGGCRYEGLAAEYLAHEQIVRKGSNSLSAVSFNHLVSRGLYEILPQLTDEMGKLNLAKTLVNLRYSFRHPIELSVQTVEYAKIFAYCFAPEFFFHVFASILGCRARFRGDRTLLWELQQGLPDLIVPTQSRPRRGYNTALHVPEVAESYSLMDDFERALVCKPKMPAQIPQLENSLRELMEITKLELSIENLSKKMKLASRMLTTILMEEPYEPSQENKDVEDWELSAFKAYWQLNVLSATR